jgi:hypothetical protein
MGGSKPASAQNATGGGFSCKPSRSPNGKLGKKSQVRMKKVGKQITKVQTEINKSQKMIKDVHTIGVEHQNTLKEDLVLTTVKNLNNYLIFHDDDLTKKLERAERLFERIVKDDDNFTTDSEKDEKEEDVEKVSVKFSQPDYSPKPKKKRPAELNKSSGSINPLGLGDSNRPIRLKDQQAAKNKEDLLTPILSEPKRALSTKRSDMRKSVASDNQLVDGVFNYQGSPLEGKGTKKNRGKSQKNRKESDEGSQDDDKSPKRLLTPSEALRRYATKLDSKSN